ATSARHSRVQSSTTARMRKRRVSVSWSQTKSRSPALVGCQRRRDRPPRSPRPLAPAAPAHGQPLLAVEALDPLLVDRMAFAPPPVARRASPLFSQQILQRGIVQHGVRQHPLQPPVLVLQRARRRLASDTSSPPNLAFHL